MPYFGPPPNYGINGSNLTVGITYPIPTVPTTTDGSTWHDYHYVQSAPELLEPHTDYRIVYLGGNVSIEAAKPPRKRKPRAPKVRPEPTGRLIAL